MHSWYVVVIFKKIGIFHKESNVQNVLKYFRRYTSPDSFINQIGVIYRPVWIFLINLFIFSKRNKRSLKIGGRPARGAPDRGRGTAARDSEENYGVYHIVT